MKTENEVEMKPVSTAKDRQTTLVNSPLSGIGITPKGTMDWSLLNPFCFDMYAYGDRTTEKGTRATYTVMLCNLLLNVFGQEVGLNDKVREELVGKGSLVLNPSEQQTSDPLVVHPQKTGNKLQGRENWIRATGKHMPSEYDEFWKRWSIAQMANPLKWGEFIASWLRLTAHYLLTGSGFWLQQQARDEENSWVARGLAFMTMCVVAIVRVAVQILGIIPYIIRAVVSPVKSFHENKGTHRLAGVLSAVISAAAIGVILYFTWPLLLPKIIPFLGAKALSLSPFLIPSIGAAMTFLSVSTSGVFRDTYIWAKYIFAKFPIDPKTKKEVLPYEVGGLKVPVTCHTALRHARYVKKDKTEEEKKKAREDIPAIIVSCVTLALPIALTLGLISGLVQRLKSSACDVGSQIASRKLSVFGSRARVPSTSAPAYGDARINPFPDVPGP